MKQAHDRDQKEVRRKTILEGVLPLFEALPFANIRMVDLAHRLGLAKGTFPTKEALFLMLLQDRMGIWFTLAEARLALLLRPEKPEAVAEALVETVLEEPDLGLFDVVFLPLLSLSFKDLLRGMATPCH